MSKKIAETLDALVLDVKFGSGAFLATEALAEQLAASLMRVGKNAGVKTRALITDMTQPLGEMIGNACEVDESIEVLQGGGPSDVRELTIELAARLLISTQRETNLDDARLRLSRLLDNGAAMERFERMVHAQGGSLSSSRPLGKSRRFLASHSGLVSSLDGQLLGQAIIAMGGGRKIAGEAIDFSVGIQMHLKIGESVETGQPLLEILCDDESASDQALRLIEQAIVISSSEKTPPEKTPPEKTATALWRDYFPET
jgi:thymidine phosphorylase